MSGEMAEAIGVREAMRLIGISGRLMKACHGQLEGSSVNNASNMSLPKKHRTA